MTKLISLIGIVASSVLIVKIIFQEYSISPALQLILLCGAIVVSAGALMAPKDYSKDA